MRLLTKIRDQRITNISTVDYLAESAPKSVVTIVYYVSGSRAVYLLGRRIERLGVQNG